MKTDLSLNEEQKEIFNQYKNEAPKVINANFSQGFIQLHMLDRNELEHHAMIGLIKGIKSYDESKGMKPSTYYIQSMIWEAQDGSKRDSLSTKNVRKNDILDRVSINAVVGEFDDSELTYQDSIVDTDDSYLIDGMTVNTTQLEQANEHLPLIIDALLRDKTHNEIAKKIGVSRSTVSRLIKKHADVIKESIILADGTTL